MLVTGFFVMIVGITTVFLFLYLLVLTMQLVSFVAAKLSIIFPEVETIEKPQQTTSENLTEIAVAIAAAVNHTKG